MTNNIPTAKEFWNQSCKNEELKSPGDIMLEFAKLHVEAALKVASENVELDYWKGDCQLCGSNTIDKESILNAYPLTNIK